MAEMTTPVERTANLEREEDSPVFEEGFTPVTNITVVKKNGRYVAVATRKIRQGELVEKSGFVGLPYRSNEPDQRAKILANFLPVIPCACDTCKIMGPNLAIPTGNIIFIQFSQQPNLDIEFDTQTAIIEIRAISPLDKGDELFVDFAKLYPKSELEQESLYKEFGEGLSNAQL